MFKKFTGPGMFRLFLALAVFFHHISRLAIGTAAVYIFFSLSGYWIFKMYTGRYSATKQRYFTYMVSRAWRLLPVFLLINLGMLGYMLFRGTLSHYWAGTNHVHFILSNFLILGYSSLHFQPIVPAWSLDVEIEFYFIAPILILLFTQLKSPGLWILVAGSISLIAALLRNPVPLLHYIVFFVAGMAAASANWRPSGKLGIASIGVTAFLIAACLASPWRGLLLIGRHAGPLAAYSVETNVILALLMIPYAMYTTSQRGFGADGMFGDLSYVIYLLHWPAVLWVGQHADGFEHKLPYSAMALVMVLIVSFGISRFYDHPINSMRARWVNSRKRTPALVEM